MQHFVSAVVARMLQSMSGQIQQSSARSCALPVAIPAGAVPKDNVPKDNAERHRTGEPEILELVRLLRE